MKKLILISERRRTRDYVFSWETSPFVKFRIRSPFHLMTKPLEMLKRSHYRFSFPYGLSWGSRLFNSESFHSFWTHLIYSLGADTDMTADTLSHSPLMIWVWRTWHARTQTRMSKWKARRTGWRNSCGLHLVVSDRIFLLVWRDWKHSDTLGRRTSTQSLSSNC